jgi:long-chain fatty acid transport protein
MEMPLHRSTRYLAVIAAFAFAPSLAHAQAFGLNEIGSCAFARGFSATSAPCNDASVIFWNPGAAVGLKGNSLYAGAAAIAIDAKFKRDSSLGEHEADVPTQIVPHIFLNHTSGTLAYGLGVYVPYGLTSQWRDDFPGVFLAKKASIKTIYIQPNIARSFVNGKWQVGGGPVIGRSSVELVQGADLADQIATVDSVQNPAVRNVIRFSQLGIARRTEFSRATLKGDAMSYGINLGVLGKINDQWSVGVRYLSSLMFKYDDADANFVQRETKVVFPAGNPLGYPANTRFDTLASVRARFCTAAGAAMRAPFGGAAATCTAVGLLGTQKVKTQIAHPDQLQFGAAYRGFKDWMIAVDYEWAGWRKFRELPVDFALDTLGTCPTQKAPTDPKCDFEVLDRTLLEDYNNTSSLRVGAEHTMKNGWLLRLGFSGVAAAAPDETVTPLLPEQDRTYWSIGTGIPLMKDRATLDVAYGFVLGSSRRGRIDERAARTVTASALNSGIYELHANVLSLSLKSSF